MGCSIIKNRKRQNRLVNSRWFSCKCIFNRENYTQMIVRGTITFFLSAKSDNAKRNTINKIKKYFQNNTGFNYLFKDNEVSFELDINSWENSIYSLIRLSQELGHQWIITGKIDFEFSAWSNNSSIVGVESINIVCDNPKYN